MASNKDNILYIARDIDRAMGKEPIGNYFIITNSTPYSQEIKNRYPDNVFLVKSEEKKELENRLSEFGRWVAFVRRI
jgi:hypothetical protein